MSQDIIKNITATRQEAPNQEWVDIRFEITQTNEIDKYEVYAVPDNGSKTKRWHFPPKSPSDSDQCLTLKELKNDVGYTFKVQAAFADDTVSSVAETELMDALHPGSKTASNAKDVCLNGHQDREDEDLTNEGEIQSTVTTCYYKMGDKIKEGKHVYKGQFSYVSKKFKDKIPPRKVAIKVLSASDYDYLDNRKGDVKPLSLTTKRMVREAKHMLELIDHPNVVQYIHSCPANNEQTLFYIFMELCSEKTLADRISKLDEHHEFNDKAYCKAIIRHLALAVHYMHEQGIYHRDIKPSNILFTEGGGVVKISDFGFSKKLCNGDISSTSSIGTRGYCSPESYAESGKVKVSDRVDVFSLGLVFFYILTKGKHPFRNVLHTGRVLESQQQQTNICHPDKRPILEGLTGPDAVLAKDLIEKMIMKDNLERPKMDEVMKHAYFWNVEQIIGFYILVHDSLAKNSQNTSDRFRSVASTEYVVEHVKEFFCVAETAAQAMTSGNEAESLEQNQSKVEGRLLSKNRFCAKLHKDVRTYIDMVRNVFKKSSKSPSQEFVDDELRVRRFFLAAQSAAEAARVLTPNNGPTREQFTELINNQRFMEKKMLEGQYFMRSSRNAKSYIETIHRVLNDLDSRGADINSESEPDQTGGAYRLDGNVTGRNRTENDDVDNESPKSFIDYTEFPNKSNPPGNSPCDVTQEILKRILRDKNNRKVTDEYQLINNKSQIPLTIPDLISVIDRADSTQFQTETLNGLNRQLSICLFDNHMSLRSEIICEVDKEELNKTASYLNEEICDPKRNRQSEVFQKAKKFENIFLKVTEQETVDSEKTGDSEGTDIPDNPNGDANAAMLLQLNRLEIFRKEVRGADYKEFKAILQELNSGPVESMRDLLNSLNAIVLRLSYAGQKGREITWKQCCDNEVKLHKEKCGNCRFIKLAESAKRQKGNDIFSFVTYIRNRLVHFEVEKSKQDGIWLETREDILTFVTLIAPELLLHMIKVTKEKDEIKRYIEDNKQKNSSFMLPSMNKDHRTVLGPPSSDSAT